MLFTAQAGEARSCPASTQFPMANGKSVYSAIWHQHQICSVSLELDGGSNFFYTQQSVDKPHLKNEDMISPCRPFPCKAG